jgi:GT2 family glycosyltransferase
MRKPTASVIVPARGHAEGLEACLEAVSCQTFPPMETIVVDNGLRGGRERILKSVPSALVVLVGTPGSYAARNGGIRRATGELLAFTDADCLPARNWLEEAVSAMARTGASVVAGDVEVTASPWGNRSGAEVLELQFGFPQRAYALSQGFGVTANLVVRREVFQRVGLFDETLLSGGDFEWGRRAGEIGYRALFVPEALVHHPARRSARDLLTKVDRVSEGICELARSGRFDPEGLLRLVLWTLSPPVVAMGRVLSDSSLGPLGARLSAAGLLCRLRMERFRALANGMLRERVG